MNTLWAAFERFLSPGISTCGCCNRPWKCAAIKRVGLKTYEQQAHNRMFGIGVEEHSTDYEEGRGCFPLCKKCWSKLTPETRLPYYEKLIFEWRSSGSEISEERAERIREAVRKGL